VVHSDAWLQHFSRTLNKKDMDDKRNNEPFDPGNQEDREENYAGNQGTKMPGKETDPESIRNPELDKTREPDQENNQPRPTPGTL
jgi:hypothetical protein